MIDFYYETDEGGKSLSWSTLCKRCGIKFYMPSTYELIAIRDRIAQEKQISADQIQIRQNGLAIL